MRVNGAELLLTLEAALADLLPLPEYLSPAPNGGQIPDLFGRYRHGEALGWRELALVTYMPGFGQDWVLVPLSGGRVVLAWARGVDEIHLVAAQRWHATVLPVLVSLTADPDGGLHA